MSVSCYYKRNEKFTPANFKTFKTEIAKYNLLFQLKSRSLMIFSESLIQF